MRPRPRTASPRHVEGAEHVVVTRRRLRALLIDDALRWTSGDVRETKPVIHIEPLRNTKRNADNERYRGGYAGMSYLVSNGWNRLPLSSDYPFDMDA